MTMTNHELLNAALRRATINEELGTFNEPLGKLEPADRAHVDRLSAEFWLLDAAIVAELQSRPDRDGDGDGVVVGGVRLKLTKDRQNFYARDAATGEIVPSRGHGWKVEDRVLRWGDGTIALDSAPRPTPHAPPPTPHAPRPSPHTPLPKPHAPRPTSSPKRRSGR